MYFPLRNSYQDGLGQLFGDLNDAPPLPSGDSKTFASLFEPVGYAIREVAREADGVVDSVRGTDPDGSNGSQLEALVTTSGIGVGGSGSGGDGIGGDGSEANNQQASSSSSSTTAAVRPNRLQYLMESSSSEEEELEEKDTAGDGVGGGEGLQMQVMKRGENKKAVPARRRDSRTGKQVVLAGHEGDHEGTGNGNDQGCLSKLPWSSNRGAKGASEDQVGDENEFDENDDEEALLDGDKPKRRRRKKKLNQKRPGDGCGCFCCLRCLCRGCCTVMTCKCCSPADPDDPAAAANSSSVDPNTTNSADAAHQDVAEKKPWFVRRHCPGCYGEGTFAATRPCCARVLRLWCALLELCRKVVMLVVALVCGLAYYFGKCLLVTMNDTLIACCPSCMCLALWCPTSHSTGNQGDDGEEWEDVPEGEPIEEEVRERARFRSECIGDAGCRF